MPVTYEILSTNTMSSVNTFTISSIPQGYTDLRAVVSFTSSATAAGFGFRLNGATTNLYGFEDFFANSNPPVAGNAVQNNFDITYQAGINTTTVPVLASIDIFSYTSTTLNKSVLFEKGIQMGTTGANDSARNFACGLFNSTSAITSLTFFNLQSNNFSGTITLFGILKA